MLDPHDRGLLSDQILPPEGFQCTGALVCTYSLDLSALAGIPLAFLQIDPQALGDDTAARIAAISAVREWSSRLTVVCQAGAIHVPAEWRDAYLWLEDTVMQVSPKAKGPAVFHPKLWLLRFQRDDEVRYRLLVLSRNLTYDRSWDVVTRLEGYLTGRQNRIRSNGPLIQFLQAIGGDALPVVGGPADRHLERRDAFVSELWTVRFEPANDDVKHFTFWPLGIPQHSHENVVEALTGPKSPFSEWVENSRKKPGRRMLVVAPFVSDTVVQALSKAPFPTLLVARQDALDDVSEHMPENWFDGQQRCVYEFLDGLSCEGAPLSGLHAKLWAVDDGHDAHVWMGSANATEAALTRNVEFLIQLTGKPRAFGIESFKGPNGMGPLIAPYIPQKAQQDQEAIDQRRRQRELGWMLTNLIAGENLQSHVEATGSQRWSLSVTRAGAPLRLDAATVHWQAWPITLPATRATAGAECTRTYTDLALHELSMFWSVVLTVPGTELRAEATVRLQPTGTLPSFQSRESAAVARHLNDPASLALYLEYLLAGGGTELARRLRRQRVRGATARRDGGNASPPLFETLLFALAEQPAALGDVVALIESAELDGSDGASQLRQDAGFQRIWAAFREARQTLALEIESH